jgi:hypothetical protein
MKSRIVEELGQAEILLPGLVAEGLRANDRAKVRLSALQAAAGHASDPSGAFSDLAAECRSAGVDAIAVKSLIAAARATGDGAIDAPGLGKLGEDLVADVEAMIAAVSAGEEGRGEAAQDRLAAIKSKSRLGMQQITQAEIAELTVVPSAGADSLHRLIMDLHKDLNRLAAQRAEEIVEGAHAHGLRAEDRPLVGAFMRGLDRTRGLKFDHPGLDTIAIRSGERLVIQNDIGTTDAHVLLVSIEGPAVTITHTDVHEPRAKFFINLFDAFPVRWSGLTQEKAQGLAEGEPFYLVAGRYEAESEARKEVFLEAIGAALVFLIDWNKARKALRKLVGNGDAIRVLDWGARHEIGHRAFLELGGAELVAAVRHATPARIGFGEELGAVLGRDSAVKYLRTALRLSTEALRKGRTARSVREALEAELVGRLERTESTLLTTIVRQMGLARDIAVDVREALAAPQTDATATSACAARARRIERKADGIAVEARGTILRSQASPTIARLLDTAENAIDELEQAAFFASLVPSTLALEVQMPLAELCDAAVAGVEAAAKGLEAAAAAPDGDSLDSSDALGATDRLAELEHVADGAERAVTMAVLKNGGDIGAALSVLELARALERATDQVSALGHQLHQHVMADLSG